MNSNNRFIGEEITVEFQKAPMLSKKPHCPDRFTWNDEVFPIVELLGEWRDYGRRGRMASNMRPEHATRAAEKGSWGVGRYYFHVRVENGRMFELYYDRAPTKWDDRQGSWFLRRELFENESNL
jgi:hypothetical protein